MKRSYPVAPLKQTTTQLVVLAYKYANALPYQVFKDFGDTQNAKRRKYDTINVLKAVNLVERRGSYLYFHPSLIKGVPQHQQLLWDYDPTATIIYEPGMDLYSDEILPDYTSLDQFDPYFGFSPDDWVYNYFHK